MIDHISLQIIEVLNIDDGLDGAAIQLTSYVAVQAVRIVAVFAKCQTNSTHLTSLFEDLQTCSRDCS